MNYNIQWYPGHMNKNLNLLKDLNFKIDLYFLILDSRAPDFFLINNLVSFLDKKKVVIVLNKTDLSEKEKLYKYVNKYKKEYLDCILVSSFHKKDLLKKFNSILIKNKNKKLVPKISIIGAPNVGKSTFINAIFDKKKTKVENRPGVTKKIVWYQFNNYWLLDTPGILQTSFKDIQQGIVLAMLGSIKYDILPLRNLVIDFFIYLKNEKNFLIFGENPEETILKKFKKSKLEEKDFFKKIIFEFQIGKFGKFLLEIN